MVTKKLPEPLWDLKFSILDTLVLNFSIVFLYFPKINKILTTHSFQIVNPNLNLKTESIQT